MLKGRREAAYTGAQVKKISAQLVSQYREGQLRIIALLRQGDITEWQRAFANQQLAQVRAILETLNENTASWVQHHIPTLYEAGLKSVNDRLLPGGLSKLAHPGQVTPMDLKFTRMHKEAIEIIGDNMIQKMWNVNAQVGQRMKNMVKRARFNDMVMQNQIRDDSLKTMAQALTDGKTQRQAGKMMIDNLKESGISQFKDASGRMWNMESYTDMVTRTVSREAVTQAQLNRTRELGGDLVEVSSHAGACELCEPWEGQILSITGETEEYNGEPISTVAEAEDAGLHHPNCAHELIPFFPEYAQGV